MEFLKHISLEMWAMFALGIVTVILFSWVTIDQNKGVQRYFKLTVKNVLFHVVASLMVFITVEELSNTLIEAYVPVLKDSGTYHLTLSGLIGMFGSWLVAWVIEKAKMKYKNGTYKPKGQ